MQLRLTWFFAFALFGAALAPSLDAAAQGGQDDARAREFFIQGRDAYDTGDWATALEKFQQSYDLSGRPELHYNIGLAQDRLRMDAEALASFEAYMAAVPNNPNQEQVNGRIAALREAEVRREAERRAFEEENRRAEQEAEEARLAAEEAERQRVLEEQRRREAEANAGGPSRWWIGVIVGVVVVGAGIGIGVALANRDDGFQDSDFGDPTSTLLRF